MTIYRADRSENRVARRSVVFLRGAPDQAAVDVFRARNLRITECRSKDLGEPDYLASVGAVVLRQSATKPRVVADDLREHGARLLDYDIRVIVRPIAAKQPMFLVRKALQDIGLQFAGRNALDEMILGGGERAAHDDPPGPHVHVFGEDASWDLIANTIELTPSGACPNSSLLVTPPDQLELADQLLVGRAFWDCTSIHLKALPMQARGSSKASVFEAYADESGDGHSSYFLKFGPRDAIFSEFEKYQEQVDRFVPFHLRPRLVHSRCVLGATRGLIVGDWVDDSESLFECARAGRAAPVISSLFDKTLRPWHRASRTETDVVLGKLLRTMEDPGPARAKRAKRLGLRRTPTELIAWAKRCTSSPVLMGRVHGDLHAANVRARKTDAVVIDFGDVTIGPLILDAAALEVSLLVGSLGSPTDVPKWKSALASAYTTADAFRSVPAGGDPRSEWRWLLDCVRQIRQHALLMEEQRGQYAVALANALMFKGGKDLAAKGAEAATRATAYVFAEKALEFAQAEGRFS